MEIIVENADWKLVKADDGLLHLQHTGGKIDIVVSKQQLLSLRAIINGVEGIA
jgi:hypothetical protein